MNSENIELTRRHSCFGKLGQKMAQNNVFTVVYLILDHTQLILKSGLRLMSILSGCP